MKTITATTEADRANSERTLARSLKMSQQQREHARTLIRPAELIQDILELDIKMTPAPNDDGTINVIDKTHLAVLSKQIDTRFRLLNKALPDLKSTEITGIIDHKVGLNPATISDIELAQRLLLWQQDQRTIAHSSNIIDVTPVVTSETIDATAEPQYDFL